MGCPLSHAQAHPSTEDALTADPDSGWVGVWGDDGQVCAYRRLEKVRVGSGDPDGLDELGAVVHVRPIPERVIEALSVDRGRSRP